jgi:hypothetical protein
VNCGRGAAAFPVFRNATIFENKRAPGHQTATAKEKPPTFHGVDIIAGSTNDEELFDFDFPLFLRFGSIGKLAGRDVGGRTNIS